MSNTWNYITIEGYCMIDLDYHMKKSKNSFKMEKDYSFTKIKNDNYDKDVKRTKTPKHCKKRGHPCYHCMSNTCKHFSFTGASEYLIIIDPEQILEEIEDVVEKNKESEKTEGSDLL
jgi:hypothetical protein